MDKKLNCENRFENEMSACLEARGKKAASKLDSILHIFAGLVLIMFAVSHFAFLSMPDNSHASLNSVFPFLTNGKLYFIAGIFEAIIGASCLAFNGSDRTNVLILSFVTVILWYRIAFYLMGGNQCGCLGLLGRLFHVGKWQEIAIPYLALLSLVTATTPWLFRHFKKFRGSTAISSTLLAFIFLQPTQSVFGGLTIHISGEINSDCYNPKSGAIYTDDSVRADFKVKISDSDWSISVTNRADNTRWEKLVWNGTNLYLFQPNKYYYAHEKKLAEATLITVSPSPVYFSLDGEDPTGLNVVWLAYGFSPVAASTNQDGVVALPLSWRGGRNSLGAYGYRWSLGEWAGWRFLNTLEVVRDHSLDLAAEQELLRSGMDYPENLVTFNLRNQDLRHRLEIPDGFVEATYNCTSWLQTNSVAIPLISEFKRYSPPFQGSTHEKPFYIAKLVAKTVSVSDEAARLLPMQADESHSVVRDYRYKKMNDTRIFKYAEYELRKGDNWKSANDPELLAKQRAWLKHGKKYRDFSNGKSVLSWLILGLIVVPVAVMMWKKQKNKSNT